jgi:hypothetical protein
MQQSQRLIIAKQRREAQKLAQQQHAEGKGEGDEQGDDSNNDPLVSFPLKLEAMEQKILDFEKKF